MSPFDPPAGGTRDIAASRAAANSSRLASNSLRYRCRCLASMISGQTEQAFPDPRTFYIRALQAVLCAFEVYRRGSGRIVAKPQVTFLRTSAKDKFRLRRDPSTIAKVTWRTTSPVGRQSTIRALPDGSGLPGAGRPLSPDGRDSKTAGTFRGKVWISGVLSMTQYL